MFFEQRCVVHEVKLRLRTHYLDNRLFLVLPRLSSIEITAIFMTLYFNFRNLILSIALSNFCHRINRILEAPRGNALLIGVGGSGKQSLSRLSAFISSLEVFQIQLRKGYSSTDLKADLGNYLLKILHKVIFNTTYYIN